jgi:hypothetical protein
METVVERLILSLYLYSSKPVTIEGYRSWRNVTSVTTTHFSLLQKESQVGLRGILRADLNVIFVWPIRGQK